MDVQKVGQLQTIFEDCLSSGVTLEQIHKEYIRAALLHSKANKTRAAKSLGLHVRTLQLKMKNYDMTEFSGWVRL